MQIGMLATGFRGAPDGQPDAPADAGPHTRRGRIAPDTLLRALAILAATAMAACVVIMAVLLRVFQAHAPDVGEASFETVSVSVSGIVVTAACVVILYRSPRQLVGWLLLVVFLLFALSGVANALADVGYFAEPGAVTAPGVWADFAESGVRLEFGAIAGLLLVFPTGRVPGGRRRWLGWAIAVVFPVWFVVHMLSPGPFAQGDELAEKVNPLGIDALNHQPWMVGEHLLLPIAGLLIVATMVSLAGRIRRSAGVERQQLKVVGLGLLVPAFTVVGLGIAAVVDSALMPTVGNVVDVGLLVVLPVSIILAMTRYRLYDIDLLINRTVVYGVLCLVLAATYALVVLLVGRVVVRAGWTSPWAVATATLASAALASPARSAIQRMVDRSFSRRAWDAQRQIEAFTARSREQPQSAEALHAVLAGALHDESLEMLFWLRERNCWAGASGEIGDPPRPTDARSVTTVAVDSEPVAALVHDSTLTRDVALLNRVTAAGLLVLENARLQAEVSEQLTEVRRSRARIVAAADAERRRVERDLHDGAQQRLVALTVRTRIAALKADSPGTKAVLTDLAAELHAAQVELRELARGIHPAALQLGLHAALQGMASRLALPVRLDLVDRRFDERAEITAYYVACEAITNAVKHARASRVDVTTRTDGRRLVLTVVDDGTGGAKTTPNGGLAGLADRVSATGGVLTVTGRLGEGTTVTAVLPDASDPPRS